MAYHDIELAVADGIAVITLNRPAERNAFSGKMGVELGQAYTHCDADDDIRAVVLTGAGRDFCVGAQAMVGPVPIPIKGLEQVRVTPRTGEKGVPFRLKRVKTGAIADNGKPDAGHGGRRERERHCAR